MSDIGFGSPQGPELESLARKCFENGRASRCPHGTYIVWALGQGIELWVQLNQREELIGLNPHFSGKTCLSLGLVQRIERDGFPMDGGFLSTALPTAGDPGHGAFQFVFDVPDFRIHDEVNLPLLKPIQLCAFAQQCSIFESEAAYRAVAAKRGFSLSSDAFVPSGFFDGERRRMAEPLASAMICGNIAEVVEIVNPLTRNRFFQIQVLTCIGKVDVVADAELLPQRAKPGQLLQCSVWLSGKISR